MIQLLNKINASDIKNKIIVGILEIKPTQLEKWANIATNLKV